ncbi:hypothetical protein Tco_0782171 [Tanacetum coccineum]
MSDQDLLSLIFYDSCISDRDFSLSLMGKVKYIISMPNLYVILEKEDLQNLSLTYLGGLWVLIERFSNSQGERLFESYRCGVVVLSSDNQLCNLCSVYWVHAKEMEAWDPSICNDSFKNGVRSVGKTLGLQLEGVFCGMRNIEVIIGSQGECNVETKMESMKLVTIKTLWGNFSFDCALSSSLGNSWGSFSGIPIDSSLTLSHLFFADYDIFIGKWESLNISTIVNVLKCFHLASGLKINFHKSKLMGIGTRPKEVDAAATTMGYSIFTTLFVHLGVKVGAIYGEDSALNSPSSLSKRSPWLDIIREIHRTCLFSLPERLKADITIRVNQIVTIFLIESSIHILDQNRYPVDKSLIHLESHKSPTKSLFDVGSRRISIITVNTKEYHSDVLAIITRIMRRTY